MNPRESSILPPAEAVEQINGILAHAWMVRHFLKHAEEIQDNPEMLSVPRTIFDYIRALEPSYQRHDHSEYLRRARGKLSKLRRAAEYFDREHLHVSDHTNFQMAAASLNRCVRELETILLAVAGQALGRASADDADEESSAPTSAREPSP